MEPGDIDVGKPRLPQATLPIGAEPRQPRLERSSVERLDRAARDHVECIGRPGEMDRPARGKPTPRLERGARGAGQRGDDRPAIALVPERRRTPGRVIPRLRLGLGQDQAAMRGKLGGKACSGDPAADYQAIHFVHRRDAVTVWKAVPSRGE